MKGRFATAADKKAPTGVSKSGGAFKVSKSMQKRYERQLRRAAKLIGSIVGSHVSGATITNSAGMMTALSAYAAALEPWARRVAGEMLDQANAANKRDWKAAAQRIGRGLTDEALESPVGALRMSLMNEQVTLIKSLPIEAGTRAQAIAVKAQQGGIRPDVAAQELAQSEGVALSRATLIARTETARASSTLTEARALSVDSPGYIWRTAGDGDVRESHADMEGTFVAWSDPPTLSDGTTTHAGQIYNCRCYPEAVF